MFKYPENVLIAYPETSIMQCIFIFVKIFPNDLKLKKRGGDNTNSFPENRKWAQKISLQYE